MRTEKLDRSLFDRLASESGRDLISFFIPTHVRGREVAQDRIRFKNQLADAARILAERGWKPRERTERLSEAEALLDDREFWEHQSAALAVFIAENGKTTTASLRRAPTSGCTVMPVFHLRSLAGDLDQPPIQILVLTRALVRLYVAVSGEIQEVESDLPESFEDVNWFVDREKQRQQHPDRAGATRNRHGHDPGSRRSEDTRRFLRDVADALTDPVTDAPLIVLGDDDLAGRFADETARRTVSPEHSGVSSTVAEEEVLGMAAPVIDGIEEQREKEAIAEASGEIGRGNAVVDIEAAVSAAISGRVERVIVDQNADAVWGRIDETTLEVTVHEHQAVPDVDLLDRLVVYTLSNGGSVVAVDSPVEDRSFTAIRRF